MTKALLLHGFARPPWPLLFAFAAAGHVAALMQPGSTALPLLCGSWRELIAESPADVLALVLILATPAALAFGWAVMLVVMMPPLLGWPVMHIWRSSLPARRPRALGFFLAAYGAVWLLAGLPLVACALILGLSMGAGPAPALFGILGALLWSASPLQRIALNRGHRLMRIGVRGWKADRDAVIFGVTHGGWCVLSCWPWMLTPMVAGSWHIPVMAAATLAMLIERLAPAGRPRWRVPTVVVLFATLLQPLPGPRRRNG